MSAKTIDDLRQQIAHLTPTEMAELKDWLETQMAAEDDQGEEITLEDLTQTLKGYEEYYHLSSEEFVRRYDARDREVLRLDHAGGWRAIYSLWEQKRDDGEDAL